MSRTFPDCFSLHTDILERTEFNELKFRNIAGSEIIVFIESDRIIRVVHKPPNTEAPVYNATVVGHTKAYANPLNDYPSKRDINDLFQRPQCPLVILKTNLATKYILSTKHVTICCSISVDAGDFTIQWYTTKEMDELLVQDLPYRAYPYNHGCGHYLQRNPVGNEFYYGGEHGSPLHLNNRRFRVEASDSLGYNAESTDPLYKITPFVLTLTQLSLSTHAYGIYYNTLNRGILDLGNEIDASVGPYRYFYTDALTLDYFFIVGGGSVDCVANVLETYMEIIGRPALPPKYTFGYLASAMGYAESDDAQQLLEKFPILCKSHDIPCDLIHLSSGYTVDPNNGARNVFTWNNNRFPDPKRLFDRLSKSGIRVSANIKPWLLDVHPKYDSVLANKGFVMNGMGTLASKTRLWSAGEGQTGSGSYFDFTSPAAQEFWTKGCNALLDVGIESLWNDNNEISIPSDDHTISMELFGMNSRHTIGSTGRPLQTLIMAYLSYKAMAKRNPGKRPFLITRSACPGTQRFASQTWSGDNSTNWHTLKHNIPMGINAQLSMGPMGYGHDIGGFVGERPSRELFIRWIQNGVLMPRFCIHSWKKEGITEPWMYPDILPIIRSAILFRYNLQSYLYTLAHMCHLYGRPIARPLLFHFPNDAIVLSKSSFEYMLGPMLLVASVVEEACINRTVYLPGVGERWYDYWNDEWYSGGCTIIVPTPLTQVCNMIDYKIGALFARAGALIPFDGPESNEKLILAFPPPTGSNKYEFELIEDDGESLGDAISRILLTMTVPIDESLIIIDAKVLENKYLLPYDHVWFVFGKLETREVQGPQTLLERTAANGQRCFGMQVKSLHGAMQNAGY